ncbi:MAG: hypothetical protein K2F73_07400, partial [Ruminococcus sp.]|nr:hypothetical protein [Ruminococcus sp.]
MNTINLLEWSINALLLLVYVFANFRLTRLIYQRSKFKAPVEFVSYLLCFVLNIALLFIKLRHSNHDYPISPYLLIIPCQYGILFLY